MGRGYGKGSCPCPQSRPARTRQCATRLAVSRPFRRSWPISANLGHRGRVLGRGVFPSRRVPGAHRDAPRALGGEGAANRDCVGVANASGRGGGERGGVGRRALKTFPDPGALTGEDGRIRVAVKSLRLRAAALRSRADFRPGETAEALGSKGSQEPCVAAQHDDRIDRNIRPVRSTTINLFW